MESYLGEDDRVILPIGATEQHGPHLPLVTDWYIAWELGRQLSQEVDVPVASPLAYGMSVFHSEFPGTITLKPATLQLVLVDILESLYLQGFRKVLVLNGHGGNGPSLASAIATVLPTRKGLKIRKYEWWRMPEIQRICEKNFGEIDSHAGSVETSLMMHFCPENVEIQSAVGQYGPMLSHTPSPSEMKLLYPDGVMQNDPRLASPQVGAEIAGALLAALRIKLEFAE